MKLAHFALLGLLAGCATSHQDDRASLLAEPVNCETAEADIAALEAAMPSSGERAKSVIQTVTPVGAVVSVVSGSYQDRAAVLTGRTKGELTARIEEIEAVCGLSESAAGATDE